MPGPRIALVSRKWPPAMGGMETYALRVSEGLAAHGTVETLVLPGQADGRPPHATSLIVWGLQTFWQLLRRRRAHDAVLIGDMAMWPMALAAGGRRAIAAQGPMWPSRAGAG